MRSITASSGLISCAEISTAISCSRVMRASSATTSCGAAQVEVRQRLIEQQQPRAGDERVRDQDPLLLAAGELADTRVGKALGVNRVQHLLDERPSGPGGPRHPETVRVDPEPHEIARAQRNIRVEQELLRHVTDQAMAASRARGLATSTRSRARRLQAEDHPEQRRLSRPVRSDQARELARRDLEADPVEDRAPGQPHADAVDLQDLLALGGRRRLVHGTSFCVETFSFTAFSSALTSASIHDW